MVSGGELEPSRNGSVVFASGVGVGWHKPGYPTFSNETPHAYATLEVVSVPSATELNRPGGEPAWQTMKAAAGAVLSAAAFIPGCEALELRYVSSAEPNGTRIRMFVTARARAWSSRVAQTAVKVACSSLPPGFQAAPTNAVVLGDAAPESQYIELRRHEELTYPQWAYIPADFYYTINDDPGDGSGWPAFWESLSQSRHETTISILFEMTDLHPDEQAVIGSLISDLNLIGEARTEFDAFGNQIPVPACMNARFARDSWMDRRLQLQRPLLARIALRGDPLETVPTATALAAALSARSDTGAAHPMYLEPARSGSDHRQARFSFDWLEILPWGGHGIWEEETAPVSLRRLPYLFGINEAASLAILPVPDEQGAPGFERSRRIVARRTAAGQPLDAGKSVMLGELLDRGEPAGPFSLPLTAINRHVLVVGQPGSGKTTTVMTLLAGLWRDHRIPFLVIEPSTRQYRNFLTIEGIGEDVQVFVLGRDDLSPMRLNPLAPPAGVRQEVHASSVLASLKMSMPLSPPLPQLLEPALRRAYLMTGWDEDTTAADGLQPPTLRDLRDNFDVVFREIDYQGEALNVGRAGRVRLDSLMSGSRGRMIDTVESVDFSTLLERPLVIELVDIKDPDDLAIVSSFILDQVRAIAEGRRSTRGELKHVTVVEEAHRLLSASDGRVIAGDDLNARSGLVRALVEAIAELRSVGEGFIISSQRPSQLSPDAVANTGTRILHRLDATDRNSILDDFDASDLDRQVAARLGKAEALARTPEQDEPVVLRVRAASGVDTSEPTADTLVGERMAASANAVRRLLPYRLCTREVCTSGCDPTVRSAGRRLGLRVGEQAKTVWNDAGGSTAALPGIAGLLTQGDHSDQVAYCGAVHLKVEQKAFRVDDGTDVRRIVARAIEDAR